MDLIKKSIWKAIMLFIVTIMDHQIYLHPITLNNKYLLRWQKDFAGAIRIMNTGIMSAL